MAELLDVYAADGTTHLGVKDRAAVHRDGDWHLAFHLWVVRAGGVLLQRRAHDKDSWPGFLDATAAGHLVAGETIEDGLREADEELGVSYAFADLVPLGIHRVDEPREAGANREHQHVFAVHDERPLEAFTAFDRDELEGLVLVGHDAFAALVAGDGPVAARDWDGGAVRDVTVRAGELVPAPYLRALAGELRRIGLSGPGTAAAR
ncbi:MAG: NUDIX domain-containing protein [Solirubrobacterales bacterium]|nr:NUDIX domain-containing protein [Solirubrobacterales bacterium]